MTEREVADQLYGWRRGIDVAPLHPPIQATPRLAESLGVGTNEPLGGTVDRDEG